jgi:hypothetical protein
MAPAPPVFLSVRHSDKKDCDFGVTTARPGCGTELFNDHPILENKPMKKAFMAATAVALALQVGSGPVLASDNGDKAAVAALAILGIAALAHHKDHYREGYQPNGGSETADFERGYRDGLYNEPFDPQRSSTAFAQGYDAGQKERANGLAHKNNSVAGVKVPQAAINACFDDAVKGVFQTSPGNVHLIKAAQEGSDTFYIDLAHGHKHVVCTVNSAGQIFNTEYRRL